MNKYEFTAAENGTRLDKFIKIPEMPRAQIQKLIDDGYATVNGKEAKASYKVKSGDVVELCVSFFCPGGKGREHRVRND